MRFFKTKMFIYKMWLRRAENHINHRSEEILTHNKEAFSLC